ncbi:bifunctional phosphopantothenoylcysteine decarboxylase/phosphopantothenate--cysteine ligase CoaBC [Endozoicomonadaceae bacterium StTr2]
MLRLRNKRILLGITGGIAAYKSAELTRELRRQGAEVHVVMTRAGQEFITPLTLQALSGNPVHTDLLDPEAEAGMGHIELARWADLVLVAPATADFMSRMAAGLGNDLLTTLCLATHSPIALAPAMNQGMWQDPATQKSIETLKGRGVTLFGPAEGSQACGEVGPGRMLEPVELVEHCAGMFQFECLTGKRVMITAGPTREAIDPVRYITNHSSGKMGFALAEAAAEAGAEVLLVAGPVTLETPERVKRVNIVSAQDLYQAVHDNMDDQDIFIGTAAVADYRPAQCAPGKLKKDPNSDAGLTIEMVRNPDIIASVAKLPEGKRPFTVGFAAETSDVVGYAKGKLQRKSLNMIIANDVSDSSIGFNSDNNAVTVIAPDYEEAIPTGSKRTLARQLVKMISQQFEQTRKQ